MISYIFAQFKSIYVYICLYSIKEKNMELELLMQIWFKSSSVEIIV